MEIKGALNSLSLSAYDLTEKESSDDGESPLRSEKEDLEDKKTWKTRAMRKRERRRNDDSNSGVRQDGINRSHNKHVTIQSTN